MAVSIVAALDLILQVSILSLLIISMAFERKKKMRLHGNLMVAALVLNLVSFAIIMGPAWDSIEGTKGSMDTVALGHAATGGLAFLLSIFLAGSWFLSSMVLKNSTPKLMRCYGQKWPMWITLILWVTSLVLGIILFVMLNSSVLGTFPISPNN